MNFVLHLIQALLPVTLFSAEEGVIHVTSEAYELPAATERRGVPREKERHGFEAVVFEESGYITSFAPRVVDGDGEVLPGDFLHHWVVGDIDAETPGCEAHGHDFAPLIAAGGELTGFDLPEGYGIPVEGERKYMAQSMFGNPTELDRSDVVFEAEIGFAPEGAELTALYPVWLDVDAECSEHGWRVPANTVETTTRTVTFPFDGTLHFAGAHLHDEARVLELRTPEGEVLISVSPTLGDGTAKTEAFVGPLTVEADREYVLEVVYENPAAHAIDAMGIVYALVEPS